MTSQYAFGRKGSNDEFSGKFDSNNVYNRRSKSIVQGVAPPSGHAQPKYEPSGKLTLIHSPSTEKNTSINEIVILGNEGQKTRYGAKWTGTVERKEKEEEFNLTELNITDDGTLKGHGKDEKGEFSFEGNVVKGSQSDVNCIQTWENKQEIYYTGKLNEQLNELTGHWSM